MALYMRKLRKDRGFTMKELGEIVGVTESAIGQYETGKRKPEYETLLRICDVLHCSAVDLFRDEKEIKNQPDDYYDLVEELQILRDRPDLRGLLHAGKRTSPDKVLKVQGILEMMEEK